MGEQFRQHFLDGCQKYGLTNKRFLQSSPFLEYIEQGKIDVKCDRISGAEWTPLAYALKKDTSLKKIRLHCEISPNSVKSRGPSRNIPSIHEVGVITRVLTGIAGCLAKSSTIHTIELQGLSLSIDGIRFFSRGLSKNNSLIYFSFTDCIMGDDEFMYLLDGLKANSSIQFLQLSSCNLGDRSGVRLAQLVRHHRSRRTTEMWEKGLRSSEEDGDVALSGLSVIDFSGNRLGDQAAIALADALRGDSYIIELDVSRNFIKMEGAKALKDMFKENVTLKRLNLRNNKEIDANIMAAINSATAINSDPSAIKVSEFDKLLQTSKAKKEQEAKKTQLVSHNKENERVSTHKEKSSQVMKEKLKPKTKEPLKEIEIRSCDGRLEDSFESETHSNIDELEMLKAQLRRENRLRLKTESKFLEAQMENHKLKKILTDPKKRKRQMNEAKEQQSLSTMSETKLEVSNLKLYESLPLFPQVDPTLPIPEQIEQLQTQLQQLQQEQLLQGENASEELLQMIEHCFTQFNHLVDQLEQGLAASQKTESLPPVVEQAITSPIEQSPMKKQKNEEAILQQSPDSTLPNLYLIEARLKEMFRL